MQFKFVASTGTTRMRFKVVRAVGRCKNPWGRPWALCNILKKAFWRRNFFFYSCQNLDGGAFDPSALLPCFDGPDKKENEKENRLFRLFLFWRKQSTKYKRNLAYLNKVSIEKLFRDSNVEVKLSVYLSTYFFWLYIHKYVTLHAVSDYKNQSYKNRRWIFGKI